MNRFVSLASRVTLLACVVTFAGGGSCEPAAKKASSDKEQAQPTKLTEEEIKRRTEAWHAELEEKALELATKGDELEARLVEREATYKRRTEAGGADYSTKQEIEKLKKEIPQIWDELARIEDLLAAGPPASLFEPEKTTHQPSSADPAKPNPVKEPQAHSVQHTNAGGSVIIAGTPHKVHVKGYTRKDGTYVAPYTRSSPKRK